MLSDQKFSNKKSIKTLDIGCGNGIFGYFTREKCKEAGLLIEEMTFSDVSMDALRICYSTCVLNEGNLKGVKEIRFKQSDLLSKIEGEFDIITCNFPQTPSNTPLKCIFFFNTLLNKFNLK